MCTDIRQIILSKGDISNSKLRVNACGFDFFPDGIIGPSNHNNGYGTQITVFLKGLNKSVKTDIPADAMGKSRGIFRERKWVKELISHFSLKAGDRINLIRTSKDKYILDIIPSLNKLRFIDLFAGIGGIRQAFEAAGTRCVFSSEWNEFAKKTYHANYSEWPEGDICKIKSEEIPDHDILTAGFPCQPFSIAGVSKKNSLGKAHGFSDASQGNLFFEILRILEAKQPRAFLLENVRNLKSHDKGQTFRIIKTKLEDLGYYVQEKIIDGIHCVPQHRERIYIIGTKPALEFAFPTTHELQTKYRMASKLGDILDKNVDEKYTLTDHLWAYLKNYKDKHIKAGNGFGYGLVGPNDTTRTLSARYYKDGSEILYHPKGIAILDEVPQTTKPRRLTPNECARLMGFDRPGEFHFHIVVSDTQAYKQFGNSVVVPVVKAIASNLVKAIQKNKIIARDEMLIC